MKKNPTYEELKQRLEALQKVELNEYQNIRHQHSGTI